MKKPFHVFANSDSLWAFYNYVTNALQFSNPKTWMEDQRILHYFIGTICNFSALPQPVSAPVINLSAPAEEEIIDPLYADPAQTNILDQIAEMETENDDTYDDTSDENDDTSIEVTDNQVVQEEVEIDTVLDQSEEIIEDTTEAEEYALTEDELAHQLYSVDNDIEVSITPQGSDFDLDNEEVIDNSPEITGIPNGTTMSDTDDTDLDFDLDFNETEVDTDDVEDFF